VPECSYKEGLALIQYRYDGGGNQRWMIEVYQSQNEKAR
jgi:hypothetical protein